MPNQTHRLVAVAPLAGALALALAAGPAASGRGRDWPMLGRTPDRNMVAPDEKNLPVEWSVEQGKQKNVKWAAELGSNAYGGPVVAGGRVFVGTNNENPRDPKVQGDKGVLMCFRASDGQFLWQAAFDKLPNANENDFPQVGIVSSPCVEGDRLYYVNNRAQVVCADTGGPRDGKGGIAWRYDMIKELGVFPDQASTCAPVVGGDLVFVVTGNGASSADQKLPAPKAPSFIALDKKTGKLAWQSNLPGDKVQESQWGSPAYAVVNGKGQAVFPGGDGYLYGFEAETGKLLWKFNCVPKQAKPGGGQPMPRYLVATPVLWENKAYIGIGRQPDLATNMEGHFWCIDMTKAGDLSPAEDNQDPRAEANKNSGLVWHFGGPAKQKGMRRFVFGATMSSCAIHGGLAYVSELDGYLHCLGARTGQEYWQHDLKAAVWAAPLVADGKVYLGDDNGDVLIFPAGKEKKESEIHTIDMGKAVKSPVVAANGMLYVQTDSTLYAIGKK
jgi:outer membrane protein assembly factor BamB